MTESSARTLANLLLGTAAAVAGYVVLRNPTLRRAALRLVRVGVTATVPGYLVGELKAAWNDTAPRAA